MLFLITELEVLPYITLGQGHEVYSAYTYYKASY